MNGASGMQSLWRQALFWRLALFWERPPRGSTGGVHKLAQPEVSPHLHELAGFNQTLKTLQLFFEGSAVRPFTRGKQPASYFAPFGKSGSNGMDALACFTGASQKVLDEAHC